MEDIAPGLLERIRALFLELLGDGAPGAGTYAAAGGYAERVGDALAAAFRRHLSGDVLPDGKMYWNIADRVVRPLLEEDWRLCAGAAAGAQRALDKAAGIGLAAQVPEPDKSRIDGILNEICAAERYGEKAWLLDEPVRTFSRAAVDETLRRNAEFHAKAGLRPRIVRTAEHGCCKWCSALAGVYDYPDVPDDVYKRHASCRCSVEYDPGGGKRQDVWTKRWTESDDVLEARKNIFGIKPASYVREVPNKTNSPENVLLEYLRNATPGKGSISYDEGYKVGKHPDEITVANWLHKTFGGNIRLLTEAEQRSVKTPDYLWNQKLWDLKRTHSINGADKLLQTGIKQIKDNPGGVILDVLDDLDMKTMERQLLGRFLRNNYIDTLDVILLTKGDLLKILRFKK